MIVVPFLVLLVSQASAKKHVRESFIHPNSHKRWRWLSHHRIECTNSIGSIGIAGIHRQKPLFGNLQNTESSIIVEPSRGSNADRWFGILVLLTVPLAWGTYTPVVKYLYQIQPPVPGLLFSSAYYTVAAISLWILLLLQQLNTRNVKPQTSATEEPITITTTNSAPFPWKGGMELGSYLFVANVLQVIGLQSVPADRAGFLIQLTTVLVPVLEAVLIQAAAHNGPDSTSTTNIFYSIPKRTWIACCLAFAGVIAFDIHLPDLVTLSGFVAESNPGSLLPAISSALQWSTGDSLIIMAAVIYSLHVVRLGKYATESTALHLATAKATVEAILSTALVLGLTTVWGERSGSALETDTTVGWTNFATETCHDISMFLASLSSNLNDINFLSGLGPAMGAVLWTGWITCAYTIYAQTFGQSRVQPTEANLIYSVQPLCTALFAFVLLGETLSPTGVLGATLIASGVYMVAVPEESSI